jgi:hypothetical protein
MGGTGPQMRCAGQVEPQCDLLDGRAECGAAGCADGRDERRPFQRGGSSFGVCGM